MHKLLTANWIRLKKNKLFWAIAICAVFATYLNIFPALANIYNNTTAIHLLYNMTPPIGLMTALMTAMFIGTEYHDGTMRNKFICGQSRTTVYLAHLLTCFFATVFFWLLTILTTLIVGIPLSGLPDHLSSALPQLFLFGLIGLLLCAVYAALCTLLAMLIHNRSFALISVMILTFLLLFFGMYCQSRLLEPEYYVDYEYWITAEGTADIVPGELIKNPLYLTGIKRQLLTFCYDFLPGGQAVQIADLNVPHPCQCILYSIGITGAVTLAGLYFFKKKDLR
ncbi:MAG: ABC transporter permease [bacterium]|nr:ABC transporter permease [bacterium]